MKKPFTITILITTLLIISSALTSSYTSYVSAETADNSRLIITGLVANPLNLSHAEIAAMPKSTVNAAIICVDFPGHVVAQGNWAGVKLRILLEAANPSAEAVKIAFYADDGYSTDLPIETAMRDDIIVAYEKDGEALGALRLVVPGKWGYKWINQLTRIELVDYDFLGFWESRGYSDEASIQFGEQTSVQVPSPLPKVDFPQWSSIITPETSPPQTPLQSPITSPAPSPLVATAEPLESQGVYDEAIYALVALLVVVMLSLAVTFGYRHRRNRQETHQVIHCHHLPFHLKFSRACDK